jgi:rhodanese-related sulfurtransferase
MLRKAILFLILFAILASGCRSAQDQSGQAGVVGKEVPVSGGSYRDVSPEELNTMLAAKEFLFVNVHIPFEGDIAGTDLSIPYNEIENHLDQLPEEKDAPVVLYCRSDSMSRIAAEKLVELGYTNVWNLDGGMIAWQQAGYELVFP